MKTKTIRQAISFRTSPHVIYEALMDSRKHTQFTGDEANISRDIGGKFTAGSGYIAGENIELMPDKKIVQWWRGSDWPENHYSKVTFSLKQTKEGTSLSFTQSGVPEQHFEEINQGWHDYYWIPLKEMLRQKNRTNRLIQDTSSTESK